MDGCEVPYELPDGQSLVLSADILYKCGEYTVNKKGSTFDDGIHIHQVATTTCKE